MTVRTYRRRGTALVELAIVLPLLILFLLGTIEVGRVLDVQQILAQAASTGGHQASLGTQTNAQVQQAVLNYLKSAGIPTTNAIISVANLTRPGVDASQAVQLDNFEVTVALPAGDISWTGTSLLVGRSDPIVARSQWVSARGRVYPSDITVPPGY